VVPFATRAPRQSPPPAREGTIPWGRRHGRDPRPWQERTQSGQGVRAPGRRSQRRRIRRPRRRTWACQRPGMACRLGAGQARARGVACTRAGRRRMLLPRHERSGGNAHQAWAVSERHPVINWPAVQNLAILAKRRSASPHVRTSRSAAGWLIHLQVAFLLAYPRAGRYAQRRAKCPFRRAKRPMRRARSMPVCRASRRGTPVGPALTAGHRVWSLSLSPELGPCAIPSGSGSILLGQGNSSVPIGRSPAPLPCGTRSDHLPSNPTGDLRYGPR
jgi:hypothetical protein